MKLRRILILVLLGATSVHAAQKDQIDWHNVEVVIRGDYFRAAVVAYADFSGQLVKRRASPNAADGDKALSEYLSSIEHYAIEVGFGRGRYLVWIKPRTSADFPVIFGGDAMYIVDAKDFKIAERQLGK